MLACVDAGVAALELAINLALARGGPIEHPGIALFAICDDSIPTGRTESARGGAAAVGGSGLIVHAKIALLAGTNFGVSTVGSPFTASTALLRGTPVGGEIDAVVALLAATGLYDLIAAACGQGAVGVAGSVSPGVLCRSKITRFGAHYDTVAASCGARTARDVEVGEGELEARSVGMAFRLKDHNLIDLADSEAKARGASRGTRAREVTQASCAVARMQDNAAGGGGMNPRQIDGELLVDEHPHVIVAVKIELLIPGILKPVAKLRREVEVVEAAHVRLVVAPTLAVDGVEGGVLELVHAWAHLREGEGIVNDLAEAGIVVPSVEGSGACDPIVVTIPERLAVGVQQGLHAARGGGVATLVLEVLMAAALS